MVAKVIQKHLRKYSVICNYDWHRNGRIWVIWNPITVAVLPIETAAQFVHCQITHHVSRALVQATFFYASNDGQVRRDLWDALCRLSYVPRDWLVLGDFNVVRSTEERAFPSASVNFLPPGISDHSPVMVTLLETQRFRKRFSFLNCWTRDPSYMDNLQRVWNSPTSGSAMFSFFFKLRKVRLMLMTLHRSNYTNIRRRVEQARDNLEGCQLQLQKSPLNADLIDEERSYLENYLKLRRAEISILT
ncbi:hypothetical protein RND81_10G239800 [Saponaria officinalis]|uniref:Endonuclease/exonuclease/phosphatase domain-containing protein n=1 Tax=Saponaria officinalis TaxID=3572 RepID=A0AAW1I7D6_SAPOF